MQKPKLFAAIAPVAAYHKAYLRSQIAEATGCKVVKNCSPNVVLPIIRSFLTLALGLGPIVF